MSRTRSRASRRMPVPVPVRVSALVFVAAALLAQVVSAEPFERSFTFDAETLRLANLIGAVEVQGHTGKEFRVTVQVRGQDASSDLITFETSNGRRAELAIRFPVGEHRRYVYPKRQGRTRFSIRDHEARWFDRLMDLGGRSIEVRGRRYRNALEVWADVRVEVPRGKRLQVQLGVGPLRAEDVEANLDLDTKAGVIEVDTIDGDVVLVTGSGSVDARRVQGNLSVDTGSGRVRVARIEGADDVRIDTGSGSVVAEEVRTQTLMIDTGSGRVDVADVDARDIRIDTGSGAVDLLDAATDALGVDTGSGSIEVELRRMGPGRYVLDSGSGSIRLAVPRSVSAAFRIDTSAGGIDVEVDGVDLRQRRRPRRAARFTVGNGDARVRVSTGSGHVRVVQATSD